MVMMTEETNKDIAVTPRKQWVDYLRAMSIILVVISHAMTYATNNYGCFLNRGGEHMFFGC